MSVAKQISDLHTKAPRITDSAVQQHSLTRCTKALKLCDEAMKLAVDAELDEAAIEMCAEMQEEAYSWVERFMYDNRSSKTLDKRRGRVFDVDKGEHVVEAINAVHVGRLLDVDDAIERPEGSRKVSFADEVRNESTRGYRS
ncbi:uncharacterized protein F4822DRAFT_400740 [Hypoxylon trugodes]|uniref:uncharacterized protein n=1 Tax=Hypoxylon trugodes TaxID=326681 RepID=UPI0021999F3C|nr:uncharacterized protein F4822DRAFT_400740 [Hypoxylon trugodes]KAI1390058.1 hypothetical protein F4822DRAFT_400740 [Hypoxylon trugodes]